MKIALTFQVGANNPWFGDNYGIDLRMWGLNFSGEKLWHLPHTEPSLPIESLKT